MNQKCHKNIKSRTNIAYKLSVINDSSRDPNKHTDLAIYGSTTYMFIKSPIHRILIDFFYSRQFVRGENITR